MVSALATRTLRPMLATLKKWWSFTTPRSMRRVGPRQDELGRGHRILRDPQRAGEIVGGAERQDRERPRSLEQGRGGRVHGPVAAAQDDHVGLVATLADQLLQGALPRQLVNLGLKAVGAQALQHGTKMRAASAAVAVRDDQHVSPHGSSGVLATLRIQQETER